MVTINTNYAATAASNSLALSNTMLQRSLNRLSSGSRIVNPNDDAGGLAVSMRLSATARRSGSAAININNAVSLLQNQDGVLKVAGKVVERMSELQTLFNDATKNAGDRGLYDIEFNQLRSQLSAISQEKFNGVGLFGSAATSIVTSAAGDQTLLISAKDMRGTGNTGTFSTLTGTGFSAPTTAGRLIINGRNVDVASGASVTDVASAINSANAGVTASGASGQLVLTNTARGATSISTTSSDASILTAVGLSGKTPVVGTATTSGSVNLLINAGSLGDSGLTATMNSALDELAQYRAQNGAEQNGLNFSAELLTLNKANLEAATSRIVDVDVAEESTQLARWTTLTQAGTAMLAQANQATSLVLKLIGQ